MNATHMTAKEMAFTPNNMSHDGKVTTTADGKVWKWSEHFNVWAGPFPVEHDTPTKPGHGLCEKFYIMAAGRLMAEAELQRRKSLEA